MKVGNMRRFLLGMASLAAISFLIVSCGSGGGTGSQVIVGGTGSQAIDGTPVALKSPVRISFFENSALSVSLQSGLLVTDYRNSVVSLLDPATLAVVTSFPISGRPLSVAALGDTVYVGNDMTRSVEVYSWLGEKLFNLGLTSGNITQPQDIAVDPDDGLVFVADGGDDEVKVFQSDGTFVRSITGAGAYLLVSPTAVAVDAANNLLMVSDYGSPVFDTTDFDPPPPRVLIFDYSGNQVSMISGEDAGGMGMGLPPPESYGFSRPQGLAYDSGYVFLVDCLRGVVLVFDISGAPAGVKTLGEFGSGDGQLFLPLDLVVDPTTKNVYVTDNRNGRVVMFAAGGVIQ